MDFKNKIIGGYTRGHTSNERGTIILPLNSAVSVELLTGYAEDNTEERPEVK